MTKLFWTIIFAMSSLSAMEKHIKENTEPLELLNVYLSIRDDQGRTPLHCAIASRNRAAAQLLIQMKAPLESTDGDGLTPLGVAVLHDPSSIELLIEAKANPLVKTDSEGNTLLHLAITSTLPTNEILKIVALLTKHMDINVRNIRSTTPLMIAAIRNSALIPGLIKMGANHSYGDDHDRTALHFAAKCNASAIKPLLDGGAHLESEDYFGGTPLYYAIQEKNEESKQILLEAGATNVSIRDVYKKEPLHTLVKQDFRNNFKDLI